MGPEEFADLLDRWGADLETWPLAERDAAGRLIEGSDRAHAMLAEAEALTAVLREMPPVLASPELKARVLSDATGARPWVWPPRLVWGSPSASPRCPARRSRSRWSKGSARTYW